VSKKNDDKLLSKTINSKSSDRVSELGKDDEGPKEPFSGDKRQLSSGIFNRASCVLLQGTLFKFSLYGIRMGIPTILIYIYK
jgi:hypothetical protein